MRAKETLFEFYDENQPLESGYISPAEDDELEAVDKKTTRRPRLTLRHLNKLRKVRKMKRKEQIVQSELVARMYGIKAEE